MEDPKDFIEQLIEAANRPEPLSHEEVRALLLEAADIISTLRILVGIRDEFEGEAGQ